MRLLFQTLDVNVSLKNLSLVRTQLTDEDVEDLFESLESNTTLEKLELDDNRLTEYSFKVLAKALAVNKGIRHLSLEGNEITKNGAEKLIAVFKSNVEINYINLANCSLSAAIMDDLIAAVEANPYIVMVDVEGNMDLNYKHIRRLQAALQSNRQRQLNEQRFEWEERRFMDEQDRNVRQIKVAKEKKMEVLAGIKEKIKDRQDWRQKLIEEELDKQKVEEYRASRRLEKEMMVRAMKKREKKKPKE